MIVLIDHVPTASVFAANARGKGGPLVIDVTTGKGYIWHDHAVVEVFAGGGSGGVSDGDKGDIVVSGSGASWALDSGVVTSAGRALLDDADAAAQRTTLGAAAASHGHIIGDVTGLQTALDGKQAAGSYATSGHSHSGLAPAGGTTSQVLKKVSNTDYDYSWQADAAGGGGYTLVATLASNQATAANTTPVNLSGLVWTFVANSVYFFRCIGKVQPAAATTGCGFQLDTSVAVTEIAMGFEHQLANTGTLSGGHSIADDASVGVSSGLPGTSTYPVFVQGMLRTGASGGTAQLRFRAEVAAVITAIAGMTLVVEKVA